MSWLLSSSTQVAGHPAVELGGDNKDNNDNKDNRDNKDNKEAGHLAVELEEDNKGSCC